MHTRAVLIEYWRRADLRVSLLQNKCTCALHLNNRSNTFFTELPCKKACSTPAGQTSAVWPYTTTRSMRSHTLNAGMFSNLQSTIS